MYCILKKNYKKQRKKMKISKETNELSRGKKGNIHNRKQTGSTPMASS